MATASVPAGFRRLAHNGARHPTARAAECALCVGDALLLAISHGAEEVDGNVDGILRFDPQLAAWEPVFTSNGSGDLGCRALAHFAGASDSAPAVYAATVSAEGARVLRSEDGREFEDLAGPGLAGAGVQNVRALLPWDQRLVALGGRIGEAGSDALLEPGAVYLSEDPRAGSWLQIAPPGLADTGNTGIAAIAVFDGALYAGTVNPIHGFELWRRPPEPSAAWERVLAGGARRYTGNEAATALAVLGDTLYVGAGGTRIGIAAGEEPALAPDLLRVGADGSWELIAGSPRFSPDGLKVPMSACGPGFDDPATTAISALAAHDGKVYAGTCQIGALDVLEEARPRPRGGFALLSSDDGESWEQRIAAGAGNACCVGVACLASTPVGLVVGTINARYDLERRRTHERPLGCSAGFEVWVSD